MQIDRRITNGLAWAGAFLVVGVPTADLLSAQFLGNGAAAPAAQVAVVTPQQIAPVPASQSQRPASKPVAVANVAPAKPVTPSSAKPTAAGQERVDALVQSGKPMPSYLTDAPTKPAQTASVTPALAATPVVPAPKPAVATAPTPVPVAPAAPVPAASAPAVAAAPAPSATPVAPLASIPGQVIDPVQTASIAPKVAPMPMPLSMRPTAVAVARPNQQTGFAVNEPVFVPPSVQPVPPADVAVDVTAEDLDEWETGPLADFLARREGRQQAQVVRPRYEEDEEVFFERDDEFQRRDRLIGPEMFFFPQ